MSIFVMGDLHLSTDKSTNKSMEKFGKRWLGYTDKIRRNWEAVVAPEDTVVIPGDDAAWIYDTFVNLGGKTQPLKEIDDMWPCTITKVK